MATFHFKAKDHDGQTVEGVVEAANRFDVYRQIRKDGRTIVSVKEGGNGVGILRFFSFSYLNSLIGSVKTSEKIVFTRNMAAMIEAGLTLSRALSVMERQTHNGVFKRVLGELGGDIKRGSSFHEALERHANIFSPLFIAMVRAGEEGGSLAASLRTVAEQMDRSYQLKKKIRGALIYPTVIIIAMVAIGILMLIFVVPTLTQTFEELGAELPSSTKLIIGVSNFFVNNTFVAIGFLFILVGSFIVGLRTRQGSRVFEFTILHVPLIGGMVRETNAARTARTLSSLLVSGVEVVGALAITKDVIQNSYYKEILERARQDIQKGSPVSKVFIENDRYYPVLFGEIVAVGEETGNLSTMLTELADFYEETVNQKTKDMSTIIEPFLMIFIGTVVGFFAISMITPIYSLSDSI